MANLAAFNAQFPQQGGTPSGAQTARGFHAAPMTMVPQRGSISSSGGLAPLPGLMARELSLRPGEQQFFDSLFYACDGARAQGHVTGGAIKNLFTQSRLPKATLATIWTLADRQKRKVLDLEDFYLACRLIAIAQQNLPVTLQSVKTYTEVPLPRFEGNSLQASTAGMNLPPQTQIQPQAQVPVQPRKHIAPMTSAGGLGATSSNASSSFPVTLNRAGSISAGGVPTDEWSMTETERTQYISLFSQADADGDGFVGGKEAQLFFKQSGLDNATLKKIWLLADVDRDNRLNPEEFSIAMHLTLRVRKKQPLPDVLPPSIDPRLRQHQQQQQSQELDTKTGKPKLNMDLLPDLLSQASPSQGQPDLLRPSSSSFDSIRPSSKPSSRRSSTTAMDFSSPLHNGAAGAVGAVGVGSQSFMSTPQHAQGGYGGSSSGSGGGSFAQSVMTPTSISGGFGFQPGHSQQQQQQQQQGYHIIEATQAIEDGKHHLSTVSNQIDQTKRSIGQLESRLEAKLKEVAQIQQQVAAQEKLLAEQQSILAGVESQFTAADEELNNSKARLAEAQDQLKNGDARIKSLQEQTNAAKRETQEVDMALALLESQLTSLRSSLTGVEQLKDNQMTILQARREQQNRLLHEKAEISDLLQASKLELQQLKEQATIMKDGLQTTQESIGELKDMLREHREIIEQEKLNPSVSMPMPRPTTATNIGIVHTGLASINTSTPSFTPSPGATEAKKSTTKSSAAEDFSFAHDDDAYNIDDIQLPTLGGETTVLATSPSSVTLNTAAADAAADSTSTATATSAASTSLTADPFAQTPSAAPLAESSEGSSFKSSFDLAPVAPVPAPPAPLPSPDSASAKSPASSVFEEDDDWGQPVESSKPAAPVTIHTDVVSPFGASEAAQVPLPASSASPPAVAATSSSFNDSFDDPFGASSSFPTESLTIDPTAARTSHPTHPSTSSISSFTSPLPPAAPAFPEALEGTGVPDFTSPSSTAADSSNPWENDESNDPFGAPSSTIDSNGHGGVQSSFDSDPFGTSTNEDPFGSSSTGTAPSTLNAFDDFGADFGAAPTASSTTKDLTDSSAVSSAKDLQSTTDAPKSEDAKSKAATNFEAAMSEDWSADFD